MTPECTENPPLNALDDRVLLRRFVQDADEAAFAEIVNRYQRLVMSVCGRILGPGADAEDAFQATFVSLAHRPRSIRSSKALSSWLYTVAYRTSWRIIRHRRRSANELLEAESMSTSVDPLDEISDAQDCVVVDEELQRLPTKFRDVLVMTYFADQTSQQIADTLDVSKGTIDGRIRDARNMLRVRLARRGVTLGALSLAAVVSQEASAAVTPALLESTVNLGAQTLANPAAPLPELSNLQTFIRPETTMISTKFLTLTMLGIAAIGAAGIGGLMAAQQTGDADGGAASLNAVVDGDDEANGNDARVLLVSQQKENKPSKKSQPKEQQPPAGLGGMMGPPGMGMEGGYGEGDIAEMGGGFGMMGGMGEGYGAGGMAGMMGGGYDMGMGPAPGPRYSHVPSNALPIEKKIYEALDEPVPQLDFPGEVSLKEIMDKIVTHVSETQKTEIKLVSDKVELDLEGLNSLDEILISDIHLEGVSLRSALSIIFEQTLDPELTYLIQNEVLMVTTVMKADSSLVNRVYPVKEILNRYRQSSGSKVEMAMGMAGAMGGPGMGIAGAGVPRMGMAGGGGPGLGMGMGAGYGGGEGGFGVGGPQVPSHSFTPNDTLVQIVMSMTSPPAMWRDVDGEGGAIQVAGDTLIVRQTPAVHEKIVELLNQLAAAP